MLSGRACMKISKDVLNRLYPVGTIIPYLKGKFPVGVWKIFYNTSFGKKYKEYKIRVK